MAIPTFRVGGPITVKFGLTNPPTVLLGQSKDGCRISFTDDLVGITSDETGSVPIDYILTGKSAEVEIIGLELAKIVTAKYFRDKIGKGESVGSLYNANTTTPFAPLSLIILEREAGTEIWEADCVWPLFDPVIFSTSQEQKISLRFQILPDVNGDLFSTIPTYLKA